MAAQDRFDNRDASGTDWSDRVGIVIDKRYRITGVLGRGGMGSVYRAEHVHLKRLVALKLLHGALGKVPEIRARFEREAFAAGRIAHPNCITASDFGELDDGSLYMVMELADGESLGNLIDREGRMPPLRALRIIRHVLCGLSHAHGYGVVHRDIKPDNIIVGPRDGDPDYARLLDFGIAKLLGQAEAEEGGERLTQAGVTFGTPVYMSPEQAFGSAIDPRSDLYSLTVVLYELLTGRPPFVAADHIAVLSMHASKRVPPLASRVTEGRFPPALEALIQRGLAKSPEKRFADAAAYIAAIDGAGEALAVEEAMTMGQLSLPASSAVRHGWSATPTGIGTAVTGPYAPVGPRWTARRWAAVASGVGLVLLIAFAAISAERDSTAAVAKAPARPTPKQSLAAKEVRPSQESVPSLQPLALEVAPPASVRDAELRELIAALEEGRRCKERRAAVDKLVALGDVRAVPALKKARYRKVRGGFLGLESRNANGCLRRAADAAIAALEGG